MRPPTDIPASELYRKLQERPKPSVVVEFPGKDRRGNPLGECRVQVLRMDEVDQARLDAERKVKKSIGMQPNERLELTNGSAVSEVLADAVAREILARSVVSVDPIKDSESPVYARIFDSGDCVRKLLSADELAVLFTHYQLAQHELGPYGENLTEFDVDMWVERLAEGARANPLAALSYPQLAELCSQALQRLATLSGSETRESPESSANGSESGPESSPSGTGSSGEEPSEPLTRTGPHESSPVSPGRAMTPDEVARLSESLHSS